MIWGVTLVLAVMAFALGCGVALAGGWWTALGVFWMLVAVGLALIARVVRRETQWPKR